MGLEDVSLMRALPTMGVFQPMDAKETEHIMEYLVNGWKGPAYVRLTRQDLPDLYPANAPFKPGKLMEIVPHAPSNIGGGKKIVCIATGAACWRSGSSFETLSCSGHFDVRLERALFEAI